MAHRIVIVHHHLRPGGVTSVVTALAEGLGSVGWEVALVLGEPPLGPWPWGLCVVDPLLSYADTAAQPALIQQAAARIAGLSGGGPVVVENPLLLKNPGFPALVDALVRFGQPVILHCHDMAPDGRHHLWQRLKDRALLLPVAPHVAWVTLNPTDARALREAGVPDASIHCLPNPVTAPPWGSVVQDQPQSSRIAYPVRGLRRKNVGEFLVHALAWSEAMGLGSFALPSEPTDRAQARIHRLWRGVAGWMASRMEPAPVIHLHPDGSSGGACFTTSVREGFGLAFCEPWMAGQPVLGRHLPDATALVEAAGLDLAGCYHRMAVPLGWVDPSRWWAARVAALPADHVQFPSKGILDQLPDPVDFAALDETNQARILRRLTRRRGDLRAVMVTEDRSGFDQTASLPDWLPMALSRAAGATDANRAILETQFSPRVIAGHWKNLFDTLASRPNRIDGYADPEKWASAVQQLRPPCLLGTAPA